MKRFKVFPLRSEADRVSPLWRGVRAQVTVGSLFLTFLSITLSHTHTHSLSLSHTHTRSLPQALDALTRLVQAWPREKGSKGSGNGSKSDNGSRVLGKGSKGKGASGTGGSGLKVSEGASKGAEVYRLNL